MSDQQTPNVPVIGPPPAGPLMCFRCATNTCGHSFGVKQSSVHGGGLIPAMTMAGGTALCLDCACEASDLTAEALART
jgi:hypothetical protein